MSIVCKLKDVCDVGIVSTCVECTWLRKVRDYLRMNQFYVSSLRNVLLFLYHHLPVDCCRRWWGLVRGLKCLEMPCPVSVSTSQDQTPSVAARWRHVTSWQADQSPAPWSANMAAPTAQQQSFVSNLVLLTFRCFLSATLYTILFAHNLRSETS